MRSWFASLLWLSACVLSAQTPAPEAASEQSPVKILAIRAIPASVTPSGPAWTKLLVDFEVNRPWIDGLQISLIALIGDGSKDSPFSLLTGLIRHLNVPRGKSTSVLFISPNTTARFGSVAAVHADIYLNDRVVSSLDWFGKGAKPDANWMAIYDRKEGALLPITATPWLTIEYDKYPDILLGR